MQLDNTDGTFSSLATGEKLLDRNTADFGFMESLQFLRMMGAPKTVVSLKMFSSFLHTFVPRWILMIWGSLHI